MRGETADLMSGFPSPALASATVRDFQIDEPLAHGLESPQVWWRRPSALLLVIALAHAVSPLMLLGAHWAFGVDESIYLSQINSFVPPITFSAPRARGATLLAAPITILTPSAVAVRLWVAALSGVGLFVAFRPWLRLRDGYLVPLAALMFSTLWMVILYGFQLMPNQWVAYATLAACGYLACYVSGGMRRHIDAAAVAMAIAALFRPSDAIFTGVGLALSCAIIPGPIGRRVRVLGALILGGAAGFAQWLIEAQLRWGGFFERMQAAQTQNGAGALLFTGGTHAAVLKGRQLCLQDCRVIVDFRYVAWWVGLGLLILAGLAYAWRRHELRLELVPLVVGLAAASQYFFTVQIVAPRFLVPAYALLCLTAATGVRSLILVAPRGAPRVLLVAVLAGGLVAHTALQVSVLTNGAVPRRRSADEQVASSARQLRAQGLTHPCRVVNIPDDVTRIFYTLGCATVPASPGSDLLRAEVERGSAVIWFSQRPPPAINGGHWLAVDVPGEPADPRGIHHAFVNVPS
jgi:hypothetical protein